jgi:2-polyprenyl-3-methyl-5-hydroxy-6-metoxy-1,4-benzoquinol methylase
MSVREVAILRTEPRHRCPACSTAGTPLYRDLDDAVWGVPGSWTLARCPRGPCGMVWLDPVPVAADLARAYARYQTHDARSEGVPERNGWLAEAKHAYLARVWGYSEIETSFAGRLLGAIAGALPGLRMRMDASVFYLRGERRGRILDVGCGSGANMAWLRSLGWNVSGVDPDPEAVAAARLRGLDVECGTLESGSYPTASFDALLLNHVIEHVPDARRTFVECRRVLTENGRLVIQTPNAASWLHRRFGRDWRGLEPPRHVQIFRLSPLARMLDEMGFAIEWARTSAKATPFAEAASRALRRARQSGSCSNDRLETADRAWGKAAALLAEARMTWDPESGDELIVHAVARTAT